MNTSRIPEFSDKSFDGMLTWFSEMSVRGLIFHPDDAPESIELIGSNKKVFTEDECQKLDNIISDMFENFGDNVYEAAYPIFMKCAGRRLDA